MASTGRAAEWFREPGREVEAKPLQKGESFAKACPKMPVISTRAARRPSWCGGTCTTRNDLPI